MSEVTRVLSAIEQGDPHAAERLLPLVYDELRQLAAQKLAQEKPGQTLDATALVHEAYLRLVGDLPDVPAEPEVADEQLLALDAALTRLAAEDPVAARVVELRHRGGPVAAAANPTSSTTCSC
jgi:hypothetical protein